MKNIELIEQKNKNIDKCKNIAYYREIKDISINRYIGYVYYKFENDIYIGNIYIKEKYDTEEYIKDSLRLLIKDAYKNNIKYLYFKTNNKINELLLDLGFKKTDNEFFKINTKNVLPNIKKLKTLDDVLIFMKENIRYGWLDVNNKIHIGNMKDFRRLYRSLSVDEILEYGIGTCIDQVKLMNYLLNRIGIKNKMFATRIYEPNDFNKLDEEEHMHCFILCYIDNKVYHIEHPNWYRIGIYEYKNEEEALKEINKYYVELSGGIIRPTTEFYKIESNITFKEFNSYINNLDISFRKLQDNKEDYEKLYNWCKNEFVYEWFEQRILSYAEIVNKYKSKLENKKQDLYIIKSNNKDIGLVQIYKFENDINISCLDKYKNAYEYDLFIGEEDYLNRSIGRKIIENINDIIYKQYKADSIILRPFKRNERAIKCYQKCNFEKVHEYIGTDTLGNKENIIVLIHEIFKENN